MLCLFGLCRCLNPQSCGSYIGRAILRNGNHATRKCSSNNSQNYTYVHYIYNPYLKRDLGHHVHDGNGDIVDERVLLRVAEVDHSVDVAARIHDNVLLVEIPVNVADI